MKELPDLAPLARAVSRGDRRSEEQLFGLLYKFVNASLKKHWRTSFSQDELSDIAMESLEKLLATFRNAERTEKVLEQGRIFGFIHVVAERTALDHNRKRSRKDKVFLSIDESSDGDSDASNWEARLQPTVQSADISDVVPGGMEAARILGSLDDKYRKVIEERVSGLEYEEIAENNGISVANARQIHKRGVTMLRQKLISKHKIVLSELSTSQSETLRRLYLKEETSEHSCPEDEALEAFYSALVGKGLFIILISLKVFL